MPRLYCRLWCKSRMIGTAWAYAGNIMVWYRFRGAAPRPRSAKPVNAATVPREIFREHVWALYFLTSGRVPSPHYVNSRLYRRATYFSTRARTGRKRWLHCISLRGDVPASLIEDFDAATRLIAQYAWGHAMPWRPCRAALPCFFEGADETLEIFAAAWGRARRIAMPY